MADLRRFSTAEGQWEVVRPLGSGGQGDVFLARSPARVAQRRKSLSEIRPAIDGNENELLAVSIWSYARPDEHSELGALKLFKIPQEGRDLSPIPGSDQYEAIQRLKNEITLLQQQRTGLPKLLGSNLEERWIITEYFPDGSLERQIERFKGKASGALRAFRSVVETVAGLHKDNFVHRDIKPANVFVRSDDELVLGDFGIVFVPGDHTRLTQTSERVGPRDYMAPWMDRGVRIDDVQCNSDVYMLGKLLWCMVAGRLKLPREYHKRADFDLAVMFPEAIDMPRVNYILDRCLVEEPGDCLGSAQQLLDVVDKTLSSMSSAASLIELKNSVELPCRVCGKGVYVQVTGRDLVRWQIYDSQNRPDNPLTLRVMSCNVCTNVQLFAPTFPETAVKRGFEVVIKT